MGGGEVGEQVGPGAAFVAAVRAAVAGVGEHGTFHAVVVGGRRRGGGGGEGGCRSEGLSREKQE